MTAKEIIMKKILLSGMYGKLSHAERHNIVSNRPPYRCPECNGAGSIRVAHESYGILVAPGVYFADGVCVRCEGIGWNFDCVYCRDTGKLSDGTPCTELHKK